ncbi:MAG: serine/threonine-protein kinase, partial [Actinoallomurus sp.]
MIGGHRLAGRLASSRTRVTYLAHDGRGGRVAVTTARAQKAVQAQVRRRLRTEAACARRLPSFCTAQLLVDGTDQTNPYLVSEFIEGPSLKQFVEDVGPLDPPQVKALAVAAARALSAIHAAGLIHCDLKPAHVLLAADGPRVIGFGIAQEIPASGRSAGIGAVADDPDWLAPEQVTGGPAGLASDVFGWACLVTYAATGRSPFADAGAVGPGEQSIRPPMEPNAWDEPLRSLVKAALATDPGDRPTADDLASRLSAVNRPAAVRPPEPGTATLPRPGTATGAATAPAPTPDAEPAARGTRRPWWTKALVLAPVGLALAAALAAVISPTGGDKGRHIPFGRGRTAAPQEATGSPPAGVQRPRSSRP